MLNNAPRVSLFRLRCAHTKSVARCGRSYKKKQKEILAIPPPPSAEYDSAVQMGEDVPEHWPTGIEINELWNTQDAFERILKFNSVTALTKYIRSKPLLCAPDIDGWRIKDLFQRIFLSSDPEYEDLKELVYDCLYIPWLKGDFMQDFAPEWAGSYLIALQKASGGIRGIAPVDIWRRATGNAIV